MLYCVRHSKRCDCKTLPPDQWRRGIIASDPELTLEGKRIAHATGLALRDMIPRNHVRLILISSPFRRCVETAWGIARCFPEVDHILIDYRFSEDMSYFSSNPFPKLTIAQYKDSMLERRGLHIMSKEEPRFPESDRAATEQRNLAQLERLEKSIATDRYNAIVVGHGCFINDVCAYFNNEDPEHRSASPGYCAITKLVMDPHSDTFRMEMAKSCAHYQHY